MQRHGSSYFNNKTALVGCWWLVSRPTPFLSVNSTPAHTDQEFGEPKTFWQTENSLYRAGNRTVITRLQSTEISWNMIYQLPSLLLSKCHPACISCFSHTISKFCDIFMYLFLKINFNILTLMLPVMTRRPGRSCGDLSSNVRVFFVIFISPSDKNFKIACSAHPLYFNPLKTKSRLLYLKTPVRTAQ
jgi:hypothetical protein